MSTNRDTLHVITPVEAPAEVLETIVAEADGAGGVTVLDLSVGTLIHPSTLKEEGDALNAENNQIRWIDGQQFAPEVGDSSRQRYLEWISEMGDQTLPGGRTIKEWFTYRGDISLWWFTPMACKNWEMHPGRWLFYMLAVLDRVCPPASADFEEAHIWTGNVTVGRALRDRLTQAVATTQIHAVSGRGETWDDDREPGEGDDTWVSWERLRAGIAKNVVHLKMLVQNVLFCWTTLDSMQDRSSVPPDREPTVLLHTQFPRSWRPREAHDTVGEDVQHLDHYFGDALSRLQEADVNVAWLPTVIWSSFEEWKQKTEGHPFGSALPWMTIPLGRALRLFANYIKWMVLFVWAFGVHKIHREWTYGNVNLGAFLFDDYWSACVRGNGMLDMLELERYRSACTALQPDAVLYRDEFYTSGRIVSAGVDDTALRIAVQHGILNREHTTYQFCARDVPDQPAGATDHVQACPVPDRFAGWGEYVKEQFATWGGYSADRVEAIGGVRHDSLVDRVQQQEIRSAERAREKHGLPTDKPVVLVCPGRAHEAPLYVRMVFDGLARREQQAFVAVKLHPFHGGDEQIHGMARQRDMSAYSIFRDEVYELLGCADALVVGTSTLAVESLLVQTPVISVVAHPRYELYPYTDENIARTVSNQRQMGEALQQVLTGGGERSAAERRTLLRRHLHNEDADACGRLASFVKAEAGFEQRKRGRNVKHERMEG